jgi:hypothetical protein
MQISIRYLCCYMLCKICGTKETDNPDGIFGNCKFCIADDKDITPVYKGTIDFRLRRMG